MLFEQIQAVFVKIEKKGKNGSKKKLLAGQFL